MLLSLQDMFSDAQAITATAASTNIIDLQQDRDIGVGQPVGILVQVVTAFNNLTNIAFAFQTATDAAFTSPVTLYTETIVLANLTKGARIWLTAVGANNLQFLRMNYTVTGTAPTVGKVTASLIRLGDRQTWQSYNDNVTQLV